MRRVSWESNHNHARKLQFAENVELDVRRVAVKDERKVLPAFAEMGRFVEPFVGPVAEDGRINSSRRTRVKLALGKKRLNGLDDTIAQATVMTQFSRKEDDRLVHSSVGRDDGHKSNVAENPLGLGEAEYELMLISSNALLD